MSDSVGAHRYITIYRVNESAPVFWEENSITSVDTRDAMPLTAVKRTLNLIC